MKEPSTLVDDTQGHDEDPTFDWSLEDAIMIAVKFPSRDEFVKNIPPNLSSEMRNEFLMVRNLVRVYGRDPKVINEQMEATLAEQQCQVEDNIKVMNDCGFSNGPASAILAEANGDLAMALQVGTTQNLEKRAQNGEFGDPVIAVEEVHEIASRDQVREATHCAGNPASQSWEAQVREATHCAGNPASQSWEAHLAKALQVGTTLNSEKRAQNEEFGDPVIAVEKVHEIASCDQVPEATHCAGNTFFDQDSQWEDDKLSASEHRFLRKMDQITSCKHVNIVDTMETMPMMCDVASSMADVREPSTVHEISDDESTAQLLRAKTLKLGETEEGSQAVEVVTVAKQATPQRWVPAQEEDLSLPAQLGPLYAGVEAGLSYVNNCLALLFESLKSLLQQRGPSYQTPVLVVNRFR